MKNIILTAEAFDSFLCALVFVNFVLLSKAILTPEFYDNSSNRLQEVQWLTMNTKQELQFRIGAKSRNIFD